MYKLLAILFIFISFNASAQRWLYPKSVYWYHLANSTRDSISVSSQNESGFVNVINKGADSTGTSSSSQAFQDAFDLARDSSYAGVIVPPGTYLVKNVRISKGCNLIANNATIKSTGASNPSTVSRIDTTDAIFHFYGSVSSKAKGLFVTGVSFIGSKSSDNIETVEDSLPDILNVWNAEQVIISNCSFSSTNRSNVICRNVSNILFSNSKFTGSSGPAIYLSGSSFVSVKSDSFLNVRHSVRAHPDTANSTLLNNFEFDNNYSETFQHGLYLALPSNVEISKNSFRPATVTGFGGDSTGAIRIATNILSGEEPDLLYIMRNIRVRSNDIRNFFTPSSLGNSILIDETLSETTAFGLSIERNYFENNARPNIRLETNAELVGNEFNGVSTSGTDTSVVYSNVVNTSIIHNSTVIAGNKITISNSDTIETLGVTANGDSEYSIYDNRLFNCSIFVDVVFANNRSSNIIKNFIRYGYIRIASIDSGFVSGNHVIASNSNVNAGIYIGAGVIESVFSDNYVTAPVDTIDCITSNFSTKVIVTNNKTVGGKNGLRCIGFDAGIISSNTFVDARQYAVDLDASSDNNLIIYNVLSGDTSDINIAGSANVDTLNYKYPISW